MLSRLWGLGVCGEGRLRTLAASLPDEKAGGCLWNFCVGGLTDIKVEIPVIEKANERLISPKRDGSCTL